MGPARESSKGVGAQGIPASLKGVGRERSFEMMVDAVLDYAIFQLDAEGFISTWNLGAKRIKGYEGAEIIGKHFSTFYPVEALDSGLPAGELEIASEDGRYEGEGWRIRKDGSKFWAHVVITALRNGEGILLGFTKVTQDLTEKRAIEKSLSDLNAGQRQRALTALAASYAHVNSVLECMSDGVVTIGWDWTIRYGNRRAFEGLPDLKIGSDYWSCFPGVLGTPTEQKLRTAMKDRTPVKYEIFYAPYGLWYKSTAFPVEEGLTLFFSDITEEKETQGRLELEQLLREKRIEALSHMAGGLAHEITNPLAIIHGRATDLRKLSEAAAPVATAEIQRTCDDILKVVNRALNILRGLRGFARDAEKDPMRLASIRDVFEECMELQQSRFESHHVEVRLDLPSDLPPVLCRATQIGQILTNLLNNAFDAIVQSNGAERWISIMAEASETALRIEVTDSGAGIEDHFKEHLMEPFFTTKEMGLGMGIGLSLSRAIAQDHGGTLILCKDTAHTCFRLMLPIGAGRTEDEGQPIVSGVTY